MLRFIIDLYVGSKTSSSIHPDPKFEKCRSESTRNIIKIVIEIKFNEFINSIDYGLHCAHIKSKKLINQY